MAELNRHIRPVDGVAAEVFVAPSLEARLLVRALGPLVAPEDGRGGLLTRALGVVVVAPFTQFTLLSFELQAFLFEVFHTRLWSRLGHGLFMPVVTFGMLLALAQVWIAPHPEAHGLVLFAPNLATVFGGILLVWYFAVAASTRLWLWWFVMVPLVLAMVAGANTIYSLHFVIDPAGRTWLQPLPLAFNPWLWMAVGALLISLSHAPEPRLPPRVNQSHRWMTVAEYLRAAPTSGEKLLRLVRLPLQGLYGTLDEWWASPRLMPYNVLMLMFRAGYAPKTHATLQEYVRRAVASGNPAIDYVGIGGGTHLRRPER